MRQVLIAMLAVTAGLIFSVGSSQATPGPVLTAPPSAVDGDMVQKVQLFPRRYYRRNGPGPYAVPPAVVVVPPVVVETPIIDGVPVAPIVVLPPRPASCGEFRYWNGVACVDARYNNPYIGPR